MPRGDVFVSYCTKSDQDAAYELVSHVEAHGIECWIAPRNVQGGTDWAAEIVDAITVCKVMVLLFSPSANNSPSVRREKRDRKSTRLNSSHSQISYAVFCLKKKKNKKIKTNENRRYY